MPSQLRRLRTECRLRSLLPAGHQHLVLGGVDTLKAAHS